MNVDKTDLIELTQLIIRLSKWPEIVGSIDIQSTEDPLYAVIRVAGHRIRNAQTIVESSILKKWFETYFGKFDFWASSVIATAEREENTQLVLRIYTCTALMFLHCAPALYVKVSFLRYLLYLLLKSKYSQFTKILFLNDHVSIFLEYPIYCFFIV